MELILKQDVEKLGFKNEIVSVKNGYGRNYLIPKGYGILATETAVKVLTENLKQQTKKEETEIAETGSIANAVNIPRGLIEMKLAPTNNDKGLNANTPIIVYCGGGSRASLAGKTLIELGFKNVQNLEGGFRGWKEFYR